MENDPKKRIEWGSPSVVKAANKVVVAVMIIALLAFVFAIYLALQWR